MPLGAIRKILGRSQTEKGLYLEVRPDGISWALASGETGFAECSPAKRAEVLGSLVSERGWEGSATRIILPLDQYQVFQVERPDGVDDSELADALKWKLKDFLDFNPSDAVSDVFRYPDDATRGRGNLVNVVAARKSLVTELRDLVLQCDLKLDSIDVAELALRRLVARLDDNDRGAALVQVRQRYGHMVVGKGSTLYLSRRLDVSDDDLHNASTQENAVQTLALELQRSLDYYESQMGQVPPAVVHLAHRDAFLPLSSMMGSYVAANVQALDWSSLGLDDGPDVRCLVPWARTIPWTGAADDDQRVDLYVADLRPRKEKLQFGSLVAAGVLAVLLVTIAGMYAHFDRSAMAQQVAAKERRIEQLEGVVDQLTAAVEKQRPDRDIEQALETINETLRRRQRLLEQVENLVRQETDGFSQPLSALARQIPEGLWLTRIRLDGEVGKVGLQGRTRSGRLVPEYLEELGQETAFQGKTFGAFNLQRDDAGRWIEFKVASDAGLEGDS